MPNLSPNLTLTEATKSQMAIRLGIDNKPTHDHFQNLIKTAVNVFQPVRDFFGIPIAVTSGYRSAELNKAIGGSPTSQHCRGEALDLDADVFGGSVMVDGKKEPLTNKMIFDYIRKNLDFDQLIWEFGNDENPNWVHVSYTDRGNRKQVLRATRVGKSTVYERYNG